MSANQTPQRRSLATAYRKLRDENAELKSRADAYPKLVEALRAWLPPTAAEDGTQDAAMRDLLRSLGEDAS